MMTASKNSLTQKAVSLLLLIGAIFGPAVCVADNVQPVYLEIEEFKPDTLRVVWKVPLNQKIPAHVRPKFPKTFIATSPKSRVQVPRAQIEKWTMVCGGQALAGSTIGISGLEETTTDALVRIQLVDGSLHRMVLRPTKTQAVVPARETSGSLRVNPLEDSFLAATPWLYVVFFMVAYLLSLTPNARKRGVLLCAIALIAGSFSGHALGSRIDSGELWGARNLTETETKRVLQGLLLNTYRAFILENDDEVYAVLSRSVAGDFLEQVYLQNRETFRTGASKGTLSIIDRLDIKSIESMTHRHNGTINVVVNWDAYGTVKHLDHIHYRCNTYKAGVTLIPVNDYWKISKVELRDESRVV